MKLLVAMVMCLMLVGITTAGDFEDEDDDAIVEDVLEEPVIMEKQIYEPPQVTGNAFLVETFDSEADFKKSWVQSQAKKDGADEEIAMYDGRWSLQQPTDNPLEGDLTLVLKSKAKHHAIGTKLDKPYEFKGKPFIVSYEVKFANGLECGGAYIKLLSKSSGMSLKNMQDKTPYTVMFGPDKCGMDHKLHFIMRHKNPKTGEFEEKHAKKPSGAIDKFFTDKKTHVYTLVAKMPCYTWYLELQEVVEPDNTFQVLVDNNVVNSGSLLTDMTPPVNPPKEIDDPNDKKPSGWDESEKIADADAEKPEDWDESQPSEISDEDAVKPDGWLDNEESLVPDPNAEKPADWDDEMDGEWEAALIDNPECSSAPGCGEWTRPIIKNPKFKGKWNAPMIDNPNYQGVWKPRRIDNPDWFEDLEPYKMTPIAALGLELWSMTDEIVFDNFIITDDRSVLSSWVQQTWERKSSAEHAASSSLPLVQGIIDVTKERPWLWAVFLVVIILPVVLVIAYCCVPRSEQGVWSTLMKAAEQRKWLWAVYCVVCLLPIVLLSICLCPRSGPVKPEDIAAYKKTDEPTPDDQGEEKEAATSEDVGPGGDNVVKPKKSKAALEAEEEEEENVAEEGEIEGEVEGEGTEESGEEDGKSQEEDTKTDSPRRSPRKRKTRKD